MATDAELPVFPFGFVDDAYELYAKKDPAYYLLKIERVLNCLFTKLFTTINKNKEWKE